MTALGRPRRIDEETRTYNMVYPISLLERLHESAAERGVSTPELIRDVLEGRKMSSEYSDGVLDACEKIRNSGRLRMKTSTGQTTGDLVADQIKKELLGE